MKYLNHKYISYSRLIQIIGLFWLKSCPPFIFRIGEYDNRQIKKWIGPSRILQITDIM